MHFIEPYFNWRHLYIASEDSLSPFYDREYSEFEFTDRIYNFLIHPQWDNIGSKTLFTKILFIDYEEQYAILEFIGEWNDCIENDIMFLKRDVIDKMIKQGIYNYILIGENVLNFHTSDDCYYEEWYEECMDQNGWTIVLNMPEQTQYDFKKLKLNRYLELMELDNWRIYKPYHLFKKIDGELNKRLEV